MSENKVTRRCCCERDDQTVTSGEIYSITKYFQQHFTGKVEAPSSWKIVKLVLLRKRGTKKRNKKLQDHRVDVGDVKVVRIMCYSSSGKITRTLDEVTRRRHSWHQLPTPSGDGDTTAAEALGVAGGQKTNGEARRDTTHNVLGPHGHQDGLRRGKTNAHRENSVRS